MNMPAQTQESSIAITLTLRSLDHALAVSQALELLARLGIGQVHAISDLVRQKAIPFNHELALTARDELDRLDVIDGICGMLASQLGFSRNAPYDIGSDHVPLLARLALEIKKVLDKALAENRDASPSFGGADYDGLTARTTQDLAPQAEVRRGAQLDQTLDQRIRDVLGSPEADGRFRNYVQAIKTYRELTGSGLKEAVDAVCAVKQAVILESAAAAGRAPMASTPGFKIGSGVRWKSQAGGYAKEKIGIVVEVVPAKALPKNKGGGWGSPRGHESYVVKVGSKLYWPIVKNLSVSHPKD